MGRWLKLLFKLLAWVVLIVLVTLLALRLLAALRETRTEAPAPGALVQTDLGALYVIDMGPRDGPPVLLIHGSIGWSAFWEETLVALAAQGYRAIAFDMPPMGWSERDPAGDYGRARQAQRVLALTEALGISPVLVAHSFGAGAGAEAVMADSSAFAGFLVVDGAIGLEAQAKPLPLPLRSGAVRQLAVSASITNPWAMQPMLRAFLHVKDRAAPYVDTLNAPMMRTGTTAAMADWLPTLLTRPEEAPSVTEEGWRGLALPTGFLWGVEDTATPLAQGERLAALVEGSRLWPLEGLGHIPQIEDPAAFQAALIEALEWVESAR
ncbi:alpha/beta fold hydrolase [Vannielia litorea]|uniref:Pimeloyl-ACP methyl ester carboxylesterase n=1 Tax=Vannielia litorea TaxID=1217970 RepID=A0A1N6HC37_9RHOB|nr:alpha/beta hydrolase [Vannielia litorea]SIO17323.1 Pimeloyl-ACP methyl ester carboxylesterase [Vannielia litorea]